MDVSFVSEKEIRRLNKAYRKKDKATDVLSFAYGRDGIMGDVLICKAVAKKNAGKFNNTYEQELKRLVIHGVLHVLGYDHGREMSHAEKIYA
ncbi:MAG: rRNA maturation RNase YbeY [Candidatus Margulisbacteria bacterium]|nr:rRNA maturation RNase YbeY [Candidatus Margulisiibacteriota bacterium]